MNHEAYDNEMIDGVNRHTHEWESLSGDLGDISSTPLAKKIVFTKTDLKTLKRGLKRTLIALITEIVFGLSVFSFIAAATATGYWAVVLFLSAIVLMVWAFIFLYAQGVTKVESKGDDK